MTLAEQTSWSLIRSIDANPATLTWSAGAYTGLISHLDKTEPNAVGGLDHRPRVAWTSSIKKASGTSLIDRWSSYPTVGDLVTLTLRSTATVFRIDQVSDDSAGLNTTIAFQLVSPEEE